MTWAAQPSHAAVTLGSALGNQPNIGTLCGDAGQTRGCLAVNDVIPGRGLVSPFDGVIVRWRALLGSGTQAQTVRIRALRRREPSVFPNQFTVISSGQLEDVAAGAGNYSFPARLPIARGDEVGLESENGKPIVWRASLVGGRGFIYSSRPADGGQTGLPMFIDNNAELTLNVDVEPDADGDGFGDETQDQCPTDGSVQGPCPDTDPPETEIDKSPPNKSKKPKAKYKFSSDEPGSAFECKLKGKGLDQAVKQFNDCDSPRKYKRLDEGKFKFKVRAIDEAGNVDPSPAKDKFKVVD